MINKIIEKIKGKNIKIVFCEGDDLRVISAAVKLKKEGILEPIFVHNKPINGITTIDPSNFSKFNEMLARTLKLRKGKWDEKTARKFLEKPNYFATMLVEMSFADGLVGGASYSTADTVRPALQLIKTTPEYSIVSSAFLLIKKSEKLVMGDCAINPTPNSEQLAEIAIQTANTARVFGIEPKVGLLSFSTNGSAQHELVSKVQKAKEILSKSNVNFPFEGELQFDSAYVESIGKKKFPNSQLAGKINTFIFPDLQSGNIGYKIAQRLGGYEAIGPIIQGLNKPINDLSRGCSADDIYKLAIITANQCL